MSRKAFAPEFEIAGENHFDDAIISLAGVRVESVGFSVQPADGAPERSSSPFASASAAPSFSYSSSGAEPKAPSPLPLAPEARRISAALEFTVTAKEGPREVGCISIRQGAVSAAPEAGASARENFTSLAISVSASFEGEHAALSVRCDISAPGAGLSIEVAASDLAAAPKGAAYYDTSVFMAGTCYIKVVLFESNGQIDANVENWTATRINEVKSQISLGVKWWEDMYDKMGYAGDLKFTIDFTYADNPFSTKYEPISRPGSSDYLWVNEFLVSQGYGSASSTGANLEQNRLYNDALRTQNGTDWAFTIYVADSKVDTDGMFADGHFGYAYLNGPYIHMTYDNDGWGIDRMQMVVAHEMGHIFGALDEYEGNGNSDYYSYGGYYNTQNLNAYNKPGGGRVASIMAESDLQQQAYSLKISSPSSLAMIGWQDTDGDGIIDVLDKPISESAVSYSYNGSTGYFSVTGTFEVTVLQRSSSGNSMTINTVDHFQYRVDGGSWITVNSIAWKADRYTVNLNFLVAQSGYLLEWRVVDADLTATSLVHSQVLRSNDNNIVGIGGAVMSLTLVAGTTGKNNRVVSGGVMEIDGTASNTVVSQGSATLNVRSGGIVSKTEVLDGGTVNVLSGGLAANTSAGAGGVEIVFSNGSARSSFIGAGGSQIVSGGLVTEAAVAGLQLIRLGTASSGTVAFGGSQILMGGVARATVVSSGASQVVSAGSAVGNTVFGVQIISGGSAAGNTIYGTQFIHGGLAQENLISSGGVQHVYAGATLSSTTVFAGGSQLVSGGTVASALVSSGGVQEIGSGASATFANIGAGAEQIVRESGTAARTGLAGLQKVLAGGIADSSFISSGGVQEVSGTARNAQVSAGGVQRLFGGGATVSTVLLSNGVMDMSGGSAQATSIYAGGTLRISGGSAANGRIYTGGLIDLVGGVAASTEIYSGGVLAVAAGGSAAATTIGAGGVLRIGSGGSATAVFVSSGARQEISSGGKASGITVSSGGILVAEAGAKLDGNVTLAGSMSAGGAIDAAGCKISLALDRRKTTDGVIVSDIMQLSGADFSVTVSAVGQSLGVYRLADNARTFRGTISVYNTNNVRLGSLTVGRTLTYGGVSYTLSTLSGQLVLRLGIPPTITITPSGWTAGNVTLTADFVAGSTEKAYSLDFGYTWLDYTRAITVTENSTVYFRSVDATGNESSAAYTVSNIDRTPPEFIMTPEAETRFSQVSISWIGADNYDGSGVVRECIRLGLSNKLSGSGTTISTSSYWESNSLGAGVWYYQIGLCDEAGNIGWSDVSSFVIGNQLFGSKGKADLLAGGDGEDRLRYEADGVWNGSYFSNGEHRLKGYNRSYDIFNGGGGYDQLLLTEGDDALFLDDIYSPFPGVSGMGPRVADVEEVLGGFGNDLIDFSSNRWTYGDVRLSGGAGDDILIGNDGNDILWGGEGNDILDGGNGDDIYVFEDNWGNDSVNDRDGVFRLVFDQSLEGYLRLSEDGLTLSHNGNTVTFLREVSLEEIVYVALDEQYFRESCDAILRTLA